MGNLLLMKTRPAARSDWRTLCRLAVVAHRKRKAGGMVAMSQADIDRRDATDFEQSQTTNAKMHKILHGGNNK